MEVIFLQPSTQNGVEKGESQRRSELTWLLYDVEVDGDKPKGLKYGINKIRVETDMGNLLEAGQHSGWTQQLPPPY